MWRGQLKYLVLWLFLAGVALIVFIQFITGHNINRLIQGNKSLLAEMQVQNDVRKLEADILTVESDIRGIIITDDTLRFPGVNSKISAIENGLDRLESELKSSGDTHLLAALQQLISHKIIFSKTILDAYNQKGKEAGEAIINTGRGKLLRDSISLLITRLDTARQNDLAGIIRLNETTGLRARLMAFFLAGMACVICIFAFFYTVNRGRQQQRMIEALNDSEKRSKEAAQIKEQFLANMSHEIRTPMNAILGFTALLKRTELQSQQLQYVEFIYSSGENLLTLINDILDLSKIEAGMMNIESAPFSLNGLVSSVETMFREKARTKGLDFQIRIEPGIHDILSGDAVRLTQILINLLSNAIKFTEKGFVHLDIRSGPTDNEQLQLAFQITDSGVGIAPEKRQRIFERFQQAEAETSRRFGGTGLGLSIVKQLLDLQKGTIEVRSEVGKGSEFTICLPFRPVQEYNVATVSVLPAEEGPESGGLLRVLVAEDNPMNQQLIRHLMKQWRIDYTIANNGREAIDLLRQHQFSLVLMDVQMPEMDGYAATQAIRRDLQNDTPIIAMTAHAMAGEKERCLSYGMNDYISKPVKEAELYAILQTYRSKQPEGGWPQTARLVDLAYLQELSMGDEAFEQLIIQQFVLQLPDELTDLEAAILAGEAVRIKALAHGMKSSVAYMGLKEVMHPFLHRMETEAANGTPDPHFKDDFQQVKLLAEQAVEEARQLIRVPAS